MVDNENVAAVQRNMQSMKCLVTLVNGGDRARPRGRVKRGDTPRGRSRRPRWAARRTGLSRRAASGNTC